MKSDLTRIFLCCVHCAVCGKLKTKANV